MSYRCARCFGPVEKPTDDTMQVCEKCPPWSEKDREVPTQKEGEL